MNLQLMLNNVIIILYLIWSVRNDEIIRLVMWKLCVQPHAECGETNCLKKIVYRFKDQL